MTQTVTIRQIVSTPVEGCTQHLIQALDEQGFPVQFQTVNDWRASICREAMIKQLPVVIESERTKYGPTIKTVTL